MTSLLTSDKEILSGLISIIKNHLNNFSSDDLQLLKGINRIVNVCVDVNGCWHGDDGKFISKGGNVNSIQKPEWMDNLSDKQLKVLEFVMDGLSNEAIGKKMGYSVARIKQFLSESGNILHSNRNNRTDTVVQAIRYGFLDLDKIKITYDENKRKQNELGNIDRNLKDKEKDLLLHLAIGLNTREIGENVWSQTEALAKVYKQSILDKLEVNDATAAVIVGLQHKIITLDEILQIRKKFLD